MFGLLDSEVEPIFGSERPGVFEPEELATVLRPTSVVRPKAVSRLSELACSDMFHVYFTGFLLRFLLNVFTPTAWYQLFHSRFVFYPNPLTFIDLTTVPSVVAWLLTSSEFLSVVDGSPSFPGFPPAVWLA